MTVLVADAAAPTIAATATFLVTVEDGGPILAPAAPLSVNAGDMVAMPLPSSDPNAPTTGPAEWLTYSLGPDAPAGATIDASDGTLYWPVPVGTSAGVYRFTTLVESAIDVPAGTIPVERPVAAAPVRSGDDRGYGQAARAGAGRHSGPGRRAGRHPGCSRPGR